MPAIGKAGRALCLAAFLCLASRAHAFIRVQGTVFVDESCHDFTFVGANTWRMLEAQAGLTGVEIDGKNPATSLLDTAAALNITVLRVFASGTTPELPLQTEPGVYNEVALRAFDQVLADAAARGLRVVLILARNWGPPDSRAIYASWSGLPSPDDFYGSPSAREDFKTHVQFMVNRVNTVTSVAYREDPTIMSWNLMNEPRFFFNSSDDPCVQNPQNCTATMQSWIEEISGFLKEQDPNHLVTVGEEGFWSKNSSFAQYNPQPQAGWAVATGQDFTANHAIPTIDYGGMHIWPDNWETTDQAFFQQWIRAHMDAAKQMNKPLVIEEYGKNVSSQDPATIETERNPTFKTVATALGESLQSGDVLRGAKYWMWDPVLTDPSSPGWANFSQDQVFPDSSTMKDIILPSAQLAAQGRSRLVPGCVPQVAAAPAPATPAAPAATPTARATSTPAPVSGPAMVETTSDGSTSGAGGVGGGRKLLGAATP